MQESFDYLEQQRQRLAADAEALARTKAQVLPHADAHAAKLATPKSPTNWGWWQSALVGLLVAANVAVLSSSVKLLRRPDTTAVVLDGSRVVVARDEGTGEMTYLVKISREDLGPLVEPPAYQLAAWNLLLLGALWYVRRRRQDAPSPPAPV